MWKFGAAALGIVLFACAHPASGVPSPAESWIRLSSDHAADGTLVTLGIDLPEKFVGRKVVARYLDVEIPLIPGSTPGKWEALFGVPFNHKPGETEVELRVGEGPEESVFKRVLSVVDGGYRSEILSVSNKHINPKKKDLLRIKKESAEIGAIYKTLTQKRYWNGPFKLPVESPITSPFGTKRVFNGQMQSFHQGLDLKASVGTPIRAPAAGRIAMAKNLFFTGNTVFIDHGYGLFTFYAHLSKLRVKLGQEIKEGQLLGLAGMTGRASGPHLHWGAVVHRSKFNPQGLMQVLQ